MPEFTADPLPYTHHTDVPSGATIAARTRDFDKLTSDAKPIIVLIHGYPQTSYLWRYIIPLLPDYPLYIPDIPGYGESKHTKITNETFSKRALGTDILTALSTILDVKEGKKQNIILIGHDRGARIIHRLAVDYSHPKAASSSAADVLSKFEILGAGLLDIVPTVVQFESFQNGKVAAGTFHWSFLAAKHPLPENMIAAYGGGKFCRDMILGWSGLKDDDESERATRVKEGAEEYVKSFDTTMTIEASCADYRAAAEVDAEEQVEDQKEWRKIRVPTLVMFSETYLGSRYDVETVWTEWTGVIDGSRKLKVKGVGNGVGHFLPEEAPAETAETLKEWIEELLTK
ncbi:alpha/beta-hydrolase [Ascobolus immersus RN42]|uniref:Alpha/beta-hydrolase n=1 Tax=Ascobolus immersus RN42 TaxID=1160509 RepID=A0A3N4ILE0_ASCIM|nr:alpha/beta-hydrolase [Ascobolus immersus RN42]